MLIVCRRRENVAPLWFCHNQTVHPGGCQVNCRAACWNVLFFFFSKWKEVVWNAAWMCTFTCFKIVTLSLQLKFFFCAFFMRRMFGSFSSGLHHPDVTEPKSGSIVSNLKLIKQYRHVPRPCCAAAGPACGDDPGWPAGWCAPGRRWQTAATKSAGWVRSASSRPAGWSAGAPTAASWDYTAAEGGEGGKLALNSLATQDQNTFLSVCMCLCAFCTTHRDDVGAKVMQVASEQLHVFGVWCSGVHHKHFVTDLQVDPKPGRKTTTSFTKEFLLQKLSKFCQHQTEKTWVFAVWLSLLVLSHIGFRSISS